MIGAIRGYFTRHGSLMVRLAAVAFICYQIGRLLRVERLITGGALSLPLDDSFIYLQYARAIAEGHPFVYTAGNAPTTGATSLLWPFLLAPPHLLRLGPSIAIAWALALGAVGLVLSAFLMRRLGERLAGAWGGVLAVALFLGTPYLLWGYMSGMEIPLYATVLLATLLLYLDEREAGRFPRLRWWLFVLACSRPEGAVLSFVLGAAMAAERWRASRAPGGPRFWSPALAIPFLAAALPFLVNLAISGSIESTSSQAKSILAEPHPEVRRRLFLGLPAVWLEIVKTHLSMLQLRQDGGAIARFAIPSAAAFIAFAVFGFFPRRRPWADGRVLLLLLPAAVLVDSLPAVWWVHHFRYQMAIHTVVLLCFAAGLARVSRLLVERLPRLVGIPLAALVSGAALLAWAPSATEQNGAVIQVYAHNCGNILDQQVKTGRWIARNLPADAIVGMNDAGAIAYYGNRATLDLLGLTTEGFARVYRSGTGCLYERLRHLPKERTPAYFAIYPEWFPYLASSGILGPEAFRAHLGFNTICGGDDKVVYPATWIDARPADSPVLPHAEIAGMMLRDALDLAWIEDEQRHEWSSHGYEFDGKKRDWKSKPTVLPRDILRQYSYADRPTRPVTDGGRVVSGWERFRASVIPARDLVLIMRTDAWYENRLEVRVDGAMAGQWTIARSGTAWVEPSFRIPGRRITRRRPVIEIRREDPKDRGDYAPFHYWVYQ